MRRSNRIKWSELKVGILVMFASGLLMWASLTGGGTSIFDSKKGFRTYFRNINGLTVGSPVWVAGVEVGNVRTISFVNIDSMKRIEIMAMAQTTVWDILTTSSKVRIGSVGLIGDKYLELIPGVATDPILVEGAVIESIEDDVGAIFRKSNEAIDNMNELSRSVQKLLSKINRGEGTLGRLAQDDSLYIRFNRVLEALSSNLRKFEGQQDKAFASIDRSARSIEKLTTAMTDTTGSVGRMIADSSLYVNLTNTLDELHRVIAKIDEGKGSVGALVNDQELYGNTKDLVARLESLLSDIQKNPRKYFKFSVF